MHTLGANLALEISQLMGRVIKSTSKRSRIFLTINNIVVVYMKLVSISHSSRLSREGLIVKIPFHLTRVLENNLYFR